ncbi:hypothetical protein [Nonomuraea mangrovi]
MENSCRASPVFDEELVVGAVDRVVEHGAMETAFAVTAGMGRTARSGEDDLMWLPTLSEFKQVAVVRRYVGAKTGEYPRYWHLMGSFMDLPDRKLIRFGRSLADRSRPADAVPGTARNAAVGK